MQTEQDSIVGTTGARTEKVFLGFDYAWLTRIKSHQILQLLAPALHAYRRLLALLETTSTTADRPERPEHGTREGKQVARTVPSKMLALTGRDYATHVSQSKAHDAEHRSSGGKWQVASETEDLSSNAWMS